VFVLSFYKRSDEKTFISNGLYEKVSIGKIGKISSNPKVLTNRMPKGKNPLMCLNHLKIKLISIIEKIDGLAEKG
jgi:hypothetical protein